MSATKLEDVRALERSIADTERTLESLRSRLVRIRKECQHQWGKVVYDPIISGGYMSPGDPPGTMGIDRRLSTWISRSEEKRWTRTCQCCGLVEHTQQTDKQVSETPRFA